MAFELQPSSSVAILVSPPMEDVSEHSLRDKFSRTSSLPPMPVKMRVKRTLSSDMRSKKAALSKVLNRWTTSDLEDAYAIESPYIDPVEEKFQEDVMHGLVYRPPSCVRWLHYMVQPAESKLYKKVFGSKCKELRTVGGKSTADCWLIHPDSYFRLIWQTLMLVVLSVSTVTLPVSVTFFQDFNSHWIEWHAFCDAVFWLDILITFRTGYVDARNDILVMDSRKTCLYYLSTWFIVDFTGVFPLCYVFMNLNQSGVYSLNYAEGRVLSTIRLIKLFNLVKVLRLARLLRYYKASHEVSGNIMTILNYFKLFSVMFLLCHWNGCLNFFVPSLQGFPTNSWVLLGNMKDKGWFEQYTNALLKSVSAMITTGYGVNAPVILSEVLIMNWCIISASVVYAMFIGHTVNLIGGFDSSGKQYHAYMQKVHEFMNVRQIPVALREKIIDFYDFKYRGKMFNEKQIVGELSDPLKEEVVSHTRETLVKVVPLLSSIQSGFVTDIVAVLKPEVFQPGDEIITAGTHGQEMYFLTEGLMEVTTMDGLFVTKLSDGAFFGEIALLTGKPRSATIHALTHCHAFSLSKENFDIIFSQHHDMEKSLALKALKRIRKLSKLMDKEDLMAHMDAIYKIINRVLNRERTNADAVGPLVHHK